ncbi:MAG TPA: hypothetical protein VGG49_02365 [Steroidobacteraceae bacterium]|jgi:hypothetical protein
MTQPDTGESTASINRRADDAAWPVIEAALRDGAELYRPTRLRCYATRALADRDPRNGRTISEAAVGRMVAAGKLVRVGVDVYALAPPAGGTA